MEGAKEAMANPDPAIDFVKARDGIINVALEERRLRMAIDAVLASPDARAEGFRVVVPGRRRRSSFQRTPSNPLARLFERGCPSDPGLQRWWAS